MSLGFRHNVVPNNGDNNGECEGRLCPQGIQFIGEFGPWCHLIKGHSRLGTGVAKKVKKVSKILDVGSSLGKSFEKHEEASSSARPSQPLQTSLWKTVSPRVGFSLSEA